jgi:hypothetical protein
MLLDLIPTVYAGIGLASVPGALLAMYRELRARPVYVPRHRAVDGPSTMQRIAAAQHRAALAAATQAGELLAGLGDRAGDQLELSRPGPRKGSYAKLRTAELDSTAERLLRLADYKRGRAALIRPVSPPWGAPEYEDVWDPIPEGVELTAIAGGTR